MKLFKQMRKGVADTAIGEQLDGMAGEVEESSSSSEEEEEEDVPDEKPPKKV